MAYRLSICLALLIGLLLVTEPRAQAPPAGGGEKKGNNDFELVERLIKARSEYQKMLEQLRAHYMSVGDLERARWSEEELRQYHRIPKQAFRLDLVVPPETLRASVNVPEANKMFTRSMGYKDKGYGTDYIDNQRRAELLFQQLITQYPQSDKIADAAYQLGDVYESKAYKQYRLAAQYFERCFQWNPTTGSDARLRAARLYDKQMLDRGKAVELYREIITHETDARRLDEANKRLQVLSGGR